MSAMVGSLVPSGKDEYPTPQAFFDVLNDEFLFTLDAAATPDNAKAAHFYTKEDDGLTRPWGGPTLKHPYGSVFVNPPYGRLITERWLDKAFRESVEHGIFVVALVPAAVGSSWWPRLVVDRAVEIRFVVGRLRFGAETSPAKFDSAVVIFCGYPPAGKPLISWVDRDGRPV